MRRFSALILVLLLPVWVGGCSRMGPTDEQAEVARTFASWKQAMIDHHIDQAMSYVPRHVDDYLAALTVVPATAPDGALSASPAVDHLLRAALAKKVSPDLRSKLTLAALVRRVADRNLFNPRDLRALELGQVSVDGDRATADVYYQGTLTALRLPFLKEGPVWKIDVLGLLPYAEVLMRVDRAIKGETENQQVDQLVSKLPSL